LHVASRMGSAGVVSLLLGAPGIDLNAADRVSDCWCIILLFIYFIIFTGSEMLASAAIRVPLA
jgi:hypothetical protein